MTTCTKGPWEIASYRNYFGFSIWSPHGPCIAERWYQHERTPEQDVEMQGNARLIAAAPELLNEAHSTDQGYDWFRDRLNDFRLYHGAWSMDESEAWANSLIAHINSRQIGTKAAIAKAEGK